MASAVPQLILVIVLIILNAAFAGSEMALVSLRPSQIAQLRTKGKRGEALANLAEDPNRFLATIQIGITLAGFLASAAAAVALAKPLEEPLSFLGQAAGATSIIIVTLILSYFTLVFGELAPKRVAMQRAEGWGLVAARPLSVLSSLTRPVVWVLGKSTNVAVRLLGGDPGLDREEVTSEELQSMVQSQETLTDEHRQILSGAFEIAERSLREVLQPRIDIFVLDDKISTADALATLAAAGHSRAPIAPDGDLDRSTHFVHLRDLVATDAETAAAVAQELVVFPESVKVLDALRLLQIRRQHIALVANEHGGAEGIITLEDLLEELVGEIYDEADPDLVEATKVDDNTFVLSGRFPIHDLIDLGINLPQGNFSTIAGLVLDRLGHLPEGPGEIVDEAGWTIEVLEVQGRTITQVRIVRTTSDALDPS